MDLPGKGVANQPVPSVAWPSATAAAKRTQGARSHVMEPRKNSTAGVVGVRKAGDRTEVSSSRETEVLPGSESVAHAHGGTRKPGRPRCFHRVRGGPPRTKSRRVVGCATNAS